MDTISVTIPKGLPGDRISVYNYRKSKTWEVGTIKDVTSKWLRDDEGGVDLRHQYEVVLDRTSASGNLIRLHVGDRWCDSSLEKGESNFVEDIPLLESVEAEA